MTLSIKQVTSCSMHSIVTTSRGADIKVEVANFCAAMDTLIGQDVGLKVFNKYIYIYVCVCVCVCVMCVCARACVRACVHTDMRIHTHMHNIMACKQNDVVL